MSRDLTPELPYDHTRRPTDGGQDVPRGGRAGGGSPPREARPADVRDALAQNLELPRTDAREPVSIEGHTYQLRHSDVRTLAAIGAFRIVDQEDLTGAARDRWHGDVEHLRQSGLVERTPYVIKGRRTAVVTLTREGKQLLEKSRRASADPDSRGDDRPRADSRQQYHAGFVKPREMSHDARLFRMYSTAAERLHTGGHRVVRVVLDYELKRDYQRFLQENNRAHRRSSGRPDRTPEERRIWADQHQLPMHDGKVKFPDVRIEYEQPDGTRAHEDLELVTPHYNASQRAGKAGFKSSNGGRSPFDPHVAERVLR